MPAASLIPLPVKYFSHPTKRKEAFVLQGRGDDFMTYTLGELKERIFTALGLDTANGRALPAAGGVRADLENRMLQEIDMMCRKLSAASRALSDTVSFDFSAASPMAGRRLLPLPDDFIAPLRITDAAGAVFCAWCITGASLSVPSDFSGVLTLLYVRAHPVISAETDDAKELSFDRSLCDAVICGVAANLSLTAEAYDFNRFIRLQTEYDDRMTEIYKCSRHPSPKRRTLFDADRCGLPFKGRWF